MHNRYLGTHIVIDTARRAFLSVEPTLKKKGYHFMEYYHSGTVRMFIAMLGLKSTYFYGKNMFYYDTQSQRLAAMKELGLVLMQTEKEDSSPHPTFLIKKLNLERMPTPEDPWKFAGLLPGRTPPVAIEAIHNFVIEVNDVEILPEVEMAVKAWRDNLSELFEAGKIPVCLTPKIVLV